MEAKNSMDREYNILRGLIYGLHVDQVARLDLFRCLDQLYERLLTLELEASARSAKSGNRSGSQESASTASLTSSSGGSADEALRAKSRELASGDWRE